MRRLYARDPKGGAPLLAQLLGFRSMSLGERPGREGEALALAREAVDVVAPLARSESAGEQVAASYVISLGALMAACMAAGDEASLGEAAWELVDFVRDGGETIEGANSVLPMALSFACDVDSLPPDVRVWCLDRSIEAMESLIGQDMSLFEEQLGIARRDRARLCAQAGIDPDGPRAGRLRIVEGGRP